MNFNKSSEVFRKGDVVWVAMYGWGVVVKDGCQERCRVEVYIVNSEHYISVVTTRLVWPHFFDIPENP